MMILIKNGMVIDPANKRADVLDILIENSEIKEISGKVNTSNRDILTFDARDMVVSPGLVDVHVHFREPGFEHKETIKTGSRAAAMGGFTTVVCEPNTMPPIDSADMVRKVLHIASENAIINVHTKAAVTRGLRGEYLTDVDTLKEAGASALSDDGNPVGNEKLMKAALINAKENMLPLSPHCEDSDYYLKEQGGRPEREPYTSESEFIKRDIELNREIGCALHFSHISYRESVEVIERAKSEGIPITAEAAPHHFTLTNAVIEKTGSNGKVNPPLRTDNDREALVHGLKSGVIDVIATDHAPHTIDEKNQAWDKAPFGIIGLETSLGVTLTALVHTGVITFYEAIEKMAVNPARIFGLNAGTLSVGSNGDIVIIDPDKIWTVNPDTFESKGRNCPFNNQELKGKAVMTMVKGKIVMLNGSIIENQDELYRSMKESPPTLSRK